ncbi:MAG TPA: methionine--tRNA ligase, partial [Candidatus Angelobacter sp.]|nr:methionine--tRNA ligase [Candidatus Angelobacter sp.]
MDKGRQKFYITTPIYYVNARPHIGHAYTTLVCDAIARRKRMLGFDTYFLTGTDEHGQKIERSAVAAGKTPKQFADEVSDLFRVLFEKMNISNDDFIRTTEPRHKAGAQELWKRIQENGYIYKGTYSGQYCVFDELYVDSVGAGAPCPECGRPTETVSEENYYFKLSAFADQLVAHYQQNPGFIRPDTRRNEVIAFVKSGLRDLSVSRSTFKWGIPVPGDPKHVMYVWLDALSNYCTAVGLGSKDPAEQQKFERYWPADVHMIGKEIIRFHCVYWPAFLLAAGLPLPKSVVAHGWLLFEESKMSKSRGNIVRAETVIDVMGNDALRYFLLREVVFGQDGGFSFDALVQRYNSDLANDLGNLSSRTLTMINRYFNGSVPYPSPTVARKDTDGVIKEHALAVIQEFGQLFDDYQFSRALESAWSLIGAVNKYLVDEEPWIVAEKEGEENKSRLATILYTAAEALRIVTALVHPVLPESTAKIWNQLGLGEISKFNLADLKWAQLPLGGKLGKVEPVFPRADKTSIERMQQMEQERAAQAASTQPSSTIAAATLAPAGEGARAGQPATQAAHGPTDAAPAPKTAPTTQAAPAAADGKISIDDF